jgi:anti-sigma B factor antagonist
MQPSSSHEPEVAALKKHLGDRPVFSVEVRPDSDGVRVVVKGEIDIATASQFEASVLDALDGGGPVVIDLSDTGFMDSTGLSVIVRLLGRLERDGGGDENSPNLVLDSPTAPVAKTLRISGIDQLVTIRDRA